MHIIKSYVNCILQNRKGECKMNISIDNLQAYLSDRYSGWATEQSMFMKLVEEIGEVAEVLNKRAGRKASDENDLQEQLGIELADMIHYIIAIAAINNINLSRIIVEKDRKASIKYDHRINLETFLSNQE
jgi:NTP pyrophosphatase (non-canonical NTP hydrolase)